jgi:hypothetical protein
VEPALIGPELGGWRNHTSNSSAHPPNTSFGSPQPTRGEDVVANAVGYVKGSIDVRTLRVPRASGRCCATLARMTRPTLFGLVAVTPLDDALFDEPNAVNGYPPRTG